MDVKMAEHLRRRPQLEERRAGRLRHIGDVVIHPAEPESAYVAALGHAVGPNGQPGIFRSRVVGTR